MKFLLMLLTLVLLSALPACNAPPGAATVQSDALPAALPAPVAPAVGAWGRPVTGVSVELPFVASDAAALTVPATLSQTSLPWALGDLPIPHAQTMPGEALGRRDKAALARLCPTVSVSSAMLHGWQRSGPRHC